MSLVTHKLDGDVATITIDRPHKLNSLNTDVLHALEAAFESVEDEARAVLLRTAGSRAFVAGADIKMFDEFSSQTEFMKFIRLQNRVNDYVEAHPAVVVSAVDGLAYGGGLELVLATDLVVADAETEFGLPEINLGFVPGGGGTQRLPRVVGPNKAKEMIITGDPITAEEGRELGLVNRVVNDGDVKTTALDLIDDAMRKAPLAVEEALRLVDKGMDASLDTALQYEQAVTAYLYTTEDNTEGIRAFNENRDPEFEGR